MRAVRYFDHPGHCLLWPETKINETPSVFSIAPTVSGVMDNTG